MHDKFDERPKDQIFLIHVAGNLIKPHVQHFKVPFKINKHRKIISTYMVKNKSFNLCFLLINSQQAIGILVLAYNVWILLASYWSICESRDVFDLISVQFSRFYLQLLLSCVRSDYVRDIQFGVVIALGICLCYIFNSQVIHLVFLNQLIKSKFKLIVLLAFVCCFCLITYYFHLFVNIILSLISLFWLWSSFALLLPCVHCVC